MKLNFREFGRGEQTLVILHGLLGSSQNWQRVGRLLGDKYHVLAIDQRNHGGSPHSPSHTFEDLREDLKSFLDQHNFDHIYLLGHSMGGLAAMEFAFHYPDYLNKLIIEDIAPRAYRSSSLDILQSLVELEIENYNSRQEIDSALAKSITDKTVRQFLLTNLVRDEAGKLGWRVNLHALLNFQAEMANYETPLHARFEGPTLFIGGEKSPYRLDLDEGLMLQHFPASRLKMVPNAGHWLHFEAMEAFGDIVVEFLEEKTER